MAGKGLTSEKSKLKISMAIWSKKWTKESYEAITYKKITKNNAKTHKELVLCGFLNFECVIAWEKNRRCYAQQILIRRLDDMQKKQPKGCAHYPLLLRTLHAMQTCNPKVLNISNSWSEGSTLVILDPKVAWHAKCNPKVLEITVPQIEGNVACRM